MGSSEKMGERVVGGLHGALTLCQALVCMYECVCSSQQTNDLFAILIPLF